MSFLTVESYEVNDESDLLLNGFLKLNEDSAAKRGKEGGEEYLRSILLRMGYNKHLKLAKVCTALSLFQCMIVTSFNVIFFYLKFYF